MREEQHTIVIQWSDEDQKFVVVLPEWEDRYAMPVASGTTYAEAVARGKNALENYIQFAREDGVPLPPAHHFAATAG
jgi:antitoxin HicB